MLESEHATVKFGAETSARTNDKFEMTKKDSTKKTGAGSPRKAPTPAAVDRELQAKIGAQLRAMHDHIIGEGVPDRFQELLARLDQAKPKG